MKRVLSVLFIAMIFAFSVSAKRVPRLSTDFDKEAWSLFASEMGWGKAFFTGGSRCRQHKLFGGSNIVLVNFDYPEREWLLCQTVGDNEFYEFLLSQPIRFDLHMENQKRDYVDHTRLRFFLRIGNRSYKGTVVGQPSVDFDSTYVSNIYIDFVDIKLGSIPDGDINLFIYSTSDDWKVEFHWEQDPTITKDPWSIEK